MKWAQLTPKQRDHLTRACGLGINPKKDPYDQTAIDALYAAALIRRLKSRKGKTLWRATETGFDLVASRGMLPTFLHRQSQYGYTHSPAMRLPGEPEAMEAA